MSTYRIPFNRPCLVGSEYAYIAEAMAAGHISGDGEFTRRCSALLRRVLGTQKVLLTTSCTHALEMCAILLDIKPGDEVVVPSFTFVSTGNAFVARGAIPRFVDIRADTLNLDERLLEGALSERTRAVVPVHYAGVGCEMDTIVSVAQRYGGVVVEDNAHGIFGKCKGRYLGTIGALATQSFHETKNFTCGEGGALIINDPAYIERAEIVREKGTNRSQYYRGEVDKYTWVDVGSSYLPSDILAAFLLAQLEQRERVQSRRHRIWNTYYERLYEWASANGVRLPSVPDSCEQSYHMFYLLLPSEMHQARLLSHLKERGILSVFHYVPLHTSQMGRRFGGAVGDCPVTESISSRLVRLPFYNDLSGEEQESVIRAIQDCPF